ncbi:MAG: class II aldolase/adducin family protein [Lachnospiraceae bacterium]|nr:class II aldolase/adducin family protein [Lachnospiraceae bacterium]
MENSLKQQFENALWVSHMLFQRKMVTGSTGNISFRSNDRIYISRSGCCFGRLTCHDFSVLDVQGNHVEGPAASKEWPLHLAVYQASPDTHAVIHTHSRYSVLWSCLEHSDETDCIPDYTPYLRMKLGKIGLIPFAAPGSEQLFQAFRERICLSDGWILKQHGAVIPGKDILNAFYAAEELEESAHIAWELKHIF